MFDFPHLNSPSPAPPARPRFHFTYIIQNESNFDDDENKKIFLTLPKLMMTNFKYKFLLYRASKLICTLENKFTRKPANMISKKLKRKKCQTNGTILIQGVRKQREHE